jgi:hypothetical protein
MVSGKTGVPPKDKMCIRLATRPGAVSKAKRRPMDTTGLFGSELTIYTRRNSILSDGYVALGNIPNVNSEL